MNSDNDWKTKVWRHYGDDSYDEAKFKPAEHEVFIKPKGGLWVSPVDSSWGWIDWCEAEDYGHSKASPYFDIMVRPETRMIVIDSLADAASKLPWVRADGFMRFRWPDWRAVIMDGWDMIVLTERGQEETRFGEPSLYGWDCESAVILNPEIILSSF